MKIYINDVVDAQQQLVDLAVTNKRQEELTILTNEFFKYKRERLDRMQYHKDEYNLKDEIKEQIAEKYALIKIKENYFGLKAHER